MHQTDTSKIFELLWRLEHLEAQLGKPKQAAIPETAVLALENELREVLSDHGLAVYRNGRSLAAVCLV